MEWKIWFWLFWVLFLFVHGSGYWRTDVNGRWGWGGGFAIFVLTAILAMGLKWNPFPSG